MAYYSNSTASKTHTGTGGSQAFGTTLRRVFAAWREQRRLFRALRDVPDAYLKDIGLTRSDVEDMIRGAGSGDPAQDLKKIMRDRSGNW